MKVHLRLGAHRAVQALQGCLEQRYFTLMVRGYTPRRYPGIPWRYPGIPCRYPGIYPGGKRGYPGTNPSMTQTLRFGTSGPKSRIPGDPKVRYSGHPKPLCTGTRKYKYAGTRNYDTRHQKVRYSGTEKYDTRVPESIYPSKPPLETPLLRGT